MFLKKIKAFLLDTLFPITCLGCGKFDVWLCDDCLEKIACCQNIIYFKNQPLKCLYFATAYKNELLQKTIHYFKYKYIEELGSYLGKIILKTVPRDENFDLIAFVPLHRKKELLRCFNQTYLLAKTISEKFGWPIIKGVLQRQRHTLPQAELDEKRRRTNIKNAFVCKNKKAVAGKKILLVDDVFTTGSTMIECARVLKESGAREVVGITVAHG